MSIVEPKIELRLARNGDAADLARLSGQLGFPITTERAESRLRDVSGAPDHAVILAESGGRVAGLAELRRVRLVTAWRQVEIVALVVDEEFRGRGIGSRLLAEAERWAYDLRCGKLRVRSNNARDRAHALYRKSGFVAARTETLFEKQLEVRPKARGFAPTSIASKGAPESSRGAAARSAARVGLAALLVADGVLRARSGAVLGLGDLFSSELEWAPAAIEIVGGLALAAASGYRGRRAVDRPD